MLSGVIGIILLMILSSGTASVAQMTRREEIPSFHSILTESESVAPRELVLRALKAYAPQGDSGKELFSILDDPATGYRNGKRLAESFIAAVQGIPDGNRPEVPLIISSQEFVTAGDGRTISVSAINYQLHLGGGLDLDYPDTLFVYWNGEVFKIKNRAVRGASLVDNRYVVFRIVRVDPEGVTRLELWSLDIQTVAMHRILDIVINRWVAQAGSHYEMEVPTWHTLGSSFDKIEAYYREAVSKSPGVCTDQDIYKEPHSPYFIHYSYDYDRRKSVYTESGGAKVEGEQFLIALSYLSGSGAPVSVRSLLKDYVMYDPNPIKSIESVFPKLSDAVQVDTILLLQELTGIICGPDPCRDFFIRLQPTARRWKKHYEEAGCNIPLRP